jgi:hypothetical protein
VVAQSGVCIYGATVEVVRGQAAGQKMTQETPCDAWGYGGGFVFKGLRPGVPMTIRASAPGYVDLEKTITPTLGPQMAVLFAPVTVSK